MTEKKDISDPSTRCPSLGSLLESVFNDIVSGEPPIEFPFAKEKWGNMAFRPGDVLGLAAPPGTGKTALAMQMVFDALRLTPEIRALVVNVEMSPTKLIERQISRLSGLSYTNIAARTIVGPQIIPINNTVKTLQDIGDRLFFMPGPFSIEMIVKSLREVKPEILLVDYVQRIDYGDGHFEPRIKLNHVMDEVRSIANAGIAVMIISAVSRTSSNRNGGYDARHMGLGSFRESSEIEYGLDDAFVLTDKSDQTDFRSGPRNMELRHWKSRSHQRTDLKLEFNGAMQGFRLIADRIEPKNESSLEELLVCPQPANPRLNLTETGIHSPHVDPWSQEFLGNE